MTEQIKKFFSGQDIETNLEDLIKFKKQLNKNLISEISSNKNLVKLGEFRVSISDAEMINSQLNKLINDLEDIINRINL
ncbi:hypothetical protein [Mesoplasma coleopterae]|uniref:Uncharacterized protein n=1 Tax=Mesoplasma coleopterae TaxID=324078 RepID=A0A2K8P2N2_9MOLU|nr:hypothetical protein [Mesoplasma coleopterae]ATZ20989.1 hypothetical protein MCOLE_v1c04770 [Mesoplasma coleopterae]AVN62480.1 hypothetical protein CG001_02410 [Mesoplasma coleopterae]